MGATRWLQSQGVEVTVTDQADPDSLAESVRQLADLNVQLHLGGHDSRDLNTADLAVINPAVDKKRSDFFAAIVRRGIPWTTEMNLFCGLCPAPVIAVTGTYGKSTTCAMLADALMASQGRGLLDCTGVHLGGNIGLSLLTELDGIQATDRVVLEMSSAQLEDLDRIDWSPEVAVITNLCPHHLDRYENYADYVAAKLNVIGQEGDTTALFVGEVDDATMATIKLRTSERGVPIHRVPQPEPPPKVGAPGEHNVANAVCVLAVCRHLGADEGSVLQALSEFRGLPHRLELVATIDDVDYYDDSKSTSPATTVTAVRSLGRTMVAIVGGKDKGVSLDGCAGVLASKCRAVICTGESGPSLAKAILAAGLDAVHEADGMQNSVQLARELALGGDAVLFSPGAPSFDAYANFAERGRRFAEAVGSLA